MNCNCICPEIDCGPVYSCIKSDLAKIYVGSTAQLDNFCLAVSTCVDEQFELIAAGQSHQFDNFGFSIIKILQSISGYTDTGDIYLSYMNGTIQWTSTISGFTYLDAGIGTTVSGAGTSGNPYEINITPSHVRGLFSASNGISYSSLTGLFKLGGALIEHTTISGANTYNLLINDIQNLTLEATGDVFMQIAGYSGANNGDVLTLIDNSTGEVSWSSPASYSNTFINNQQAVVQTANFKINGNGFIGSKLTAGTTAQVSDVSHLFTGVGVDLIPLQVNKSSGTTLFYVGNEFLFLPNGVIDPAGTLPNNAVYFNSTTNKLRFYNAVDGWHTKAIEPRQINTQHSLTGGGDLSANRTISLVNDAASPGNNQYYGTNGTGTKGWYASALGVSSVALSMPSFLSVVGSPITSSGTFTVSLATQSANTLLIGPTTGPSAAPTFRALVTNDIPNSAITYAKIQNVSSARLLGRTSGGSGILEELTVGQHMSLGSGVLNTVGRTLINIQIFTSSDTYIKSPGCNAALVHICGAGGGGAGALSNVAEASVGSGGGAGGYAVHFIPSGLGASEIVTVGTGGTGGVAGGNGGNGSSSSFGSHCIATGGFGGTFIASGSAIAIANGGASGFGTGNILSSYGETGRPAFRLGTSLTSIIAGNGGGTPMGYYSGSSNNTGAGGPGSGAINGDDEPATQGSDGIVIVFEYS